MDAYKDELLWPLLSSRRCTLRAKTRSATLSAYHSRGRRAEALRLAAKHATAANVFGSPNRITELARALEGFCHEVGRDFDEIEVSLHADLAISLTIKMPKHWRGERRPYMGFLSTPPTTGSLGGRTRSSHKSSDMPRSGSLT